MIYETHKYMFSVTQVQKNVFHKKLCLAIKV